jgi:hypothetical protein
MAPNSADVLGSNPSAFGHTCWSSLFVFTDPGIGVGAAYILNRMGADPRVVDLCRVIAECC